MDKTISKLPSNLTNLKNVKLFRIDQKKFTAIDLLCLTISYHENVTVNDTRIYFTKWNICKSMNC
jgi:CRISPR/Cas system-associated protein endoribonuclease Cas2